MFALVNYEKQEIDSSLELQYIREIVSDTIYKGLKFAFTFCGDTDIDLMIDFYFGNDFFRELAEFLRFSSDYEAARNFLKRKTIRMMEKMLDKNEDYTFDVFEEYLFYVAIQCIKVDMELLPENNKCDSEFYDKSREKEVAERLKEFGYTPRKSLKKAREILRFQDMFLNDDEDDNLFFWDDDFLLIFNEGFCEGIRKLISAVWEMQGYGYEYTCNIFSDAGCKIPLMLVGTKEANRIRNEEETRRIREVMDDIGKKIMGSEDSELPFN